MSTPTPETDAAEFKAYSDGDNSSRRVVSSDFARNLENRADVLSGLVSKLDRENEELRKVCDLLATSLALWHPDHGVIPNPAFSAYKNLPHVKAKKP